MKTNVKFRFIILFLIAFILLLSLSATFGAAPAFASEKAYYVCFSNQNYAVRNANLMTEEDSAFILKGVSLTSTIDFYITDGAGLRWYAADDKPMKVTDAAELKYDIKFSPDAVFSEESDFAKTNCHFTYRFNVPASYCVTVDGKETELTYNPHKTDYELYYISSIFVAKDAEIVFNEEKHSVSADGLYRILFTPGKTENGNVYKFDKNGSYGSGDGYEYSLYIEDAPEFYAVFKEEVQIGDPDLKIDGLNGYRMTRYEKNVTACEYRTTKFFIPERDVDVKYFIYEKTPGGSFALIDEDNDPDTPFGKKKAADAGWYALSFTDATQYATAIRREETPFNGWYVSGGFNGYCFDEKGLPDPDDGYRFTEINEGEADYNADYTQFVFYFTASETALKEGDVELCITDGKSIYKDGEGYIALNTAGRYKFIFSPTHTYGRNRHYKYVLLTEDGAYRDLTVSDTDEFIEFAKNCSLSADYSVKLRVYLKQDLDFANVDFVPVSSFSGEFYGGYHTMKNIKLSLKSGTSVFTVVNRAATIERLFVELNADGEDSDYVGFIGKNYGTVRYVETKGTASGKSYVGGIAAYNGKSAADDSAATTDSEKTAFKSKIENCSSSLTVNGRVHVGGIVGYNSGDITSCTFDGEVAAKKTSSSATVFNVGGVAGYSSGRISDCVSLSAVKGGSDSLYVGGIVGLCTGEVYFSENKGEVNASRYAGGIVGYYGTIGNNDDRNDFFNGMDIDAIFDSFFPSEDDSFEQGTGDANIINYCINNGAVSALSYSGGVIGNATVENLKIYNCGSLGSVEATAGSYVGGICARGDNVDIKGCVSSGLLQAKGLNGGKYVGGIIGYGGSVYASMSAATLKGSDYVGGIVGYGIGKVISSYANVLLSVEENSANSGSVIGFTEAYKDNLGHFEGNVKANYYIGNIGGIGGKAYGDNYNYAAAQTDSDKLSSVGALSPHLCEDFDRSYFQGGETLSYPTARRFEEVDSCSEYGDDDKWNALFAKHAKDLKNTANDVARLTFTVTVSEWHKGDLKNDDGDINYQNFEIIAVLRAFQNETVELPALKYAVKQSGEYVYKTDDASYFADVPTTVVADGNISIYAQYTEAVTTLTVDNDKAFVEGFFRKGTKAELVKIGELYSVKLSYNGEALPLAKNIIKFNVNDSAENYSVYIVDGAEERTAAVEPSGQYVKFELSEGEYFRVELNAKAPLPYWAWLLIGIAAAVVAIVIAVLVVYLVKKHKKTSQGEKA